MMSCGLNGGYMLGKAGHETRIARNALLQEDSTPHEDPKDLLREAQAVIGELGAVVLKINVANLGHSLPDGRNLTAAMAQREGLTQRHALLQSAIEATQKEPERYSTRKIKWVAAVDVAKLQKQSDDISRQLRELHARIQESNWQVEI